MTPTEHAHEILAFVPDHIEAEAHAHALIRDAELLGADPVEHAAHVLAWVESIFETGDDTDAESETLLRMQEGAAVLVIGRD